jgi:cytochrome c biogenesis protein CcmG, thiol:disulfide interchange protein DsbE
VLLVALLGWQVITDGGDEVRSSIVGRAAPAVQGTAIDGRAVDIDRWRGSWVVVNFFATWCVPCVREHPELVAFAEDHVDDNVELVSVAFDDTPADIERFFAQRGGDWPVLATDTGSIALDYGVRGVPESFLVAPDGRVVGLFYGVTARGLDEAIATYERSGSATEPDSDQPVSTRPGAPS